ncbi:MAG: GMC oxidoreductase [Chloroflexota bacterium]
MQASSHYDVIIIGTGAGGGTLAYALAPTGKRILVIERGGYVPREKDNWDTKAVTLEAKYHNAEAWLDQSGKEFHPGAHYFVGGNTKFYGAALLRLRREDFGEIQHAGGVSPAWPIGYDDLEPYYTRAEHLYHVHGERGSDPTEPEASAPYRFPAITHEPRIQQLADDLKRQGLQPFSLPMGVMLDEANPQTSACIRCDTCDGHPCLVNAKADSQVICVDPALQYPNVTLITHAVVERLETSPSGRQVSGVRVRRGDAEETFSADIVVSSCGAINSAALMLRSANEKHPNGVGNSSDQVGRNYMCHTNAVMLAISKQANPTIFQKTLGINDYYFHGPDWDFPMGHISFVGKTDANVLRAGAPPLTPGFTLEQMARHSLDFWLTSEDLPLSDNRVTIDRDARIRLAYQPNNLEGHQRLTAKLKDLLGHLDCHEHLIPQHAYIGKRIPLAGVAHQNGTMRFGIDPTASALDVNCQAHDLDNLYVVDGSFFVSSGAVNPALTIMANALRVGDHLMDRLGVPSTMRTVTPSFA